MIAIYSFDLYGLAGRSTKITIASDIDVNGDPYVNDLKEAAIKALGPTPSFVIEDLRYSVACDGQKPSLILFYKDRWAAATDGASPSYGTRVGGFAHYVPHHK